MPFCRSIESPPNGADDVRTVFWRTTAHDVRTVFWRTTVVRLGLDLLTLNTS
jgi:hypothetical protein